MGGCKASCYSAVTFQSGHDIPGRETLGHEELRASRRPQEVLPRQRNLKLHDSKKSANLQTSAIFSRACVDHVRMRGI